MSLEYLGAEPVQRGILVRVKNAPTLVAREGGAAGAIAATLVPQTIEGVVLDKMADQFRQNLRDKGVDAEVTIVSADQKPVAKSGGFGVGIVAGAGLVGAGYAGWKYVGKQLVEKVKSYVRS